MPGMLSACCCGITELASRTITSRCPFYSLHIQWDAAYWAANMVDVMSEDEFGDPIVVGSQGPVVVVNYNSITTSTPAWYNTRYTTKRSATTYDYDIPDVYTGTWTTKSIVVMDKTCGVMASDTMTIGTPAGIPLDPGRLTGYTQSLTATGWTETYTYEFGTISTTESLEDAVTYADQAARAQAMIIDLLTPFSPSTPTITLPLTQADGFGGYENVDVPWKYNVLSPFGLNVHLEITGVPGALSVVSDEFVYTDWDGVRPFIENYTTWNGITMLAMYGWPADYGSIGSGAIIFPGSAFPIGYEAEFPDYDIWARSKVTHIYYPDDHGCGSPENTDYAGDGWSHSSPTTTAPSPESRECLGLTYAPGYYQIEAVAFGTVAYYGTAYGDGGLGCCPP